MKTSIDRAGSPTDCCRTAIRNREGGLRYQQPVLMTVDRVPELSKVILILQVAMACGMPVAILELR
jgi:hypothetical protein